MNASIITIGDELLLGQVIDTNSAYIAQELNKSGIAVRRRIAIADERLEILAALKEVQATADLIIVTGGLGPTNDDVTKATVCEFFGSKLVVNEEILEMVKNLFAKFNRPMIDVNYKQAEVPDNCLPIKNHFGTAPGLWFENSHVNSEMERSHKVFVFMPGVPFEMKPMFTEQVLPKVRQRFNTSFILHRTIHTQGLGESFLAEKIKDVETNLPSNFKLAYLPHYSLVRLRISGTGDKEQKLQQQVNELEQQVAERIGEYIFGFDETSIEIEIGKVLREKNKTVATAESITGGLIASKITGISGASDYFKGGVVTYANAAKQQLLGVKEETLSNPGAVSEETVREMVAGAIKLLNTDYAIAVSGIAGPDGGSEKNPVGTVWMAAGDADKIVSRKFQFTRTREIIREYTAITALVFLWRFITGRIS